MLSVTEAQQIVLGQVRPLSPVAVPLAPAALGLVLAEDVASDLDMPPYDKALMDGFAVRSADLQAGPAELTIVDEIMAGMTPRRPINAGQTARIMTGAPIPEGADAVVMVERCRLLDGNRVGIDEARPEQNVLRRGREMRRGEVVLTAGMRLRPQEIGLLASVGRTMAQVYPAPRVTVLPTGDEIVDPGEVPGPGQIRNSNGPMLLAQVQRAGAVPRSPGIARDRLDSLRALIVEGLRDDVLVLSGGVSAGKLDLVPGVLAELGVHALFHKVAMKPGKPVLFGVQERDAGPPRLVFGLPGNPVSALVCFELFVRPALRGLMGREPGPRLLDATLAEDYDYRTDRPTYHPARLEASAGGWQVRPVPWFGSPDLRGIAAANAFVLFPPGETRRRAGQVVAVLCPEEV